MRVPSTILIAVRYYAEWLDGEYLLLQHAYAGYDHAAVMQRALRYHALFRHHDRS